MLDGRVPNKSLIKEVHKYVKTERYKDRNANNLLKKYRSTKYKKYRKVQKVQNYKESIEKVQKRLLELGTI
jgi:uncharacterized protein YaaN involved in tellurite resistance